MKSLYHWYQELPEPYRSQAMKNALITLTEPADSLAQALKKGFVFGLTDEEEKDPGYWYLIYQKAKEDAL